MDETRAPLMPRDMGVIQPSGYAVPVVYRVLSDGQLEVRLLGEPVMHTIDEALRSAIEADRRRPRRL